MENATEALIMAGSVLLLIIALTVSISSLSNLRTQAQDIIMERDRVEITQDSEGSYINYIKNDDKDVRIVGIESIISSIRRMWKEDYTIYLATNNLLTEIPQELRVSNVENLSNTQIIQGKNIIKLSQAGVGNQLVKDEKILTEIYNYSKVNDKKFKEYIGIYQNKAIEGVSEANKNTYKIITFVEE